MVEIKNNTTMMINNRLIRHAATTSTSTTTRAPPTPTTTRAPPTPTTTRAPPATITTSTAAATTITTVSLQARSRRNASRIGSSSSSSSSRRRLLPTRTNAIVLSFVVVSYYCCWLLLCHPSTAVAVVDAFIISPITFNNKKRTINNCRMASDATIAAAAVPTMTTTMTATTASISISDSYDGGNIQLLDIIYPPSPSAAANNNNNTKKSVIIVSLSIKPDPYTELEQTNHRQYFSFRSIVVVAATKPSKATTTNNDNNDNEIKNGNNNNNNHDDDDAIIVEVQYVIENAGEASYARAFHDYTVFYSKEITNPYSWQRHGRTEFVNGKLSWTHQYRVNANDNNNKSYVLYFCYFPPYSYNRHLQLIERCCMYTKVESLGQSIDKRDIECITVGTGPTVCWIIHRQHPGEHMAEYYAEGLLQRLLGTNTGGSVDGLVQKILQLYTFYIVPNMCPDGAVRGHLRTNAVGANLNREWTSSRYRKVDDNNNDDNQNNISNDKNNKNGQGKDDDIVEYIAPTIERSPEVYYVLNKMMETGCDVFLDVHGDEALPFNFLAQPATPNFDQRLESLHGAFLAAYCRSNPDMQQQYGYPVMSQPSTIFNTACKQISYRFNCLAVTLEMPFKDCLSNPDPERGWNPARSMQLGASVLDPLLYVHPYVRADEATEFWKSFPPEDAYIRPTPMYRKQVQQQ